MSLPSTGIEICNMALSLIGWTDAITSLTADSNKADRQCNVFYSITFHEMLELFSWGATIEHRPLVLTSGFKEFNDVYGTTAPTISGITQANPGVITATGHGFSTGHYIRPYDISGMTELNDERLYCTDTDDDTITLTGINTTNFTEYSSGGSIVRIQPKSKYDTGYTYDIPSNFILGISLEDYSSEFEIIESAGSKELLTTTQNAVLSYVKSFSDDEDVDELQMTALFLNTFAIRMAIKIAVPIMGLKAGLEIKSELKRDYKLALDEAQLAEAMNTKTQYDTSDSWLSSRK